MSIMRRLDYRNLLVLEEWQLLVAQLSRIEQDYIEEILELAKIGKVSEMLDRAGRVSMIKDFVSLPMQLFPAENGK